MGLVACDRRDWEDAARRGQAFVQRCPNNQDAWWHAAEPALRQGHYVEAEKILAEGFFRLGREPLLVQRFAEISTAREDWAAAAQRWALTLRLQPRSDVAHRHLADALRHLDRLDDLDAVLTAAVLRFPGKLAFGIEHANAASARGDWDVALARWRALHLCSPNDSGVQDGILDAERQAALMHPSAHPPLPIPARVDAGEGGDPKLLLSNFESLGENCEFGVVQREAGLEPLGLTRFASISIANLVTALDNDFAGFGDPEFTRVYSYDDNEWIVDDTRNGFFMHTFINLADASNEIVARRMQRHITFLKRKLLEDLARADKIFVRTTLAEQPLEHILRLYRALRRHGPCVLLLVQQSSDPAQIGRASWLTESLMIGWLEHLSPAADTREIGHGQWHDLCRGAHTLWAKRAAGP